MSYRIERAVTGRATCKDAVCKKNGVKIDKGDLRLGTWVTIQENASWAWKHWGCVTGKQIENLRTALEDPKTPGTYMWDAMDGLEDEGEKNPLSEEQKEKVKRAITQGFIDPQDFNGDPEMNKLGQKGIHTPISRKKTKETEVDPEHAQDAPSPSKPPTKKRDRGKKAADDDDEPEEEAKPVKKRAKKTPAVKDEDADEKPKPARKPRAKKAKKEEEEDDEEIKEEEESEEEVMPVKKSRGMKAVKKEEIDELALEEEVKAPAKPAAKSRGRKAMKKEEEPEDNGVHAEEVEAVKAKPAPAKRGRKPKAKAPEAASEEGSKDESTMIPGFPDEALRREYEYGIKQGEGFEDFNTFLTVRKRYGSYREMIDDLNSQKESAPKATKGKKGSSRGKKA